ncbi:serine hydrolase domain-containing protein [Ostreiculturibacter nitratireducens]|uniref:serine hydrolase domain-containing protein n=1 Tax=Ostreiculturibacter nitratireducens TaxID=3075226 RepID=UPI0031B6052A
MSWTARRRALSVVTAMALWLVVAVAALADEDAEIATRLDALADAVMVTDQVPGAIAAVVSGDTVILRGYGIADLDGGIAAGPDDTRFEIGSITKLFTWIAVMMLVEEGRLDLGSDVAQYLSEVEVPGTEPLTLTQLMSHRGGFEESYAIFDPAVATLPRAEALSVAAPDQVFPRGEITSYSNWGAALAGHVVEEVSGQPRESFVEARILGPLGMDDTTTAERLRRPDQPPLAGSYRMQGGVAHPAFRVDIGAFGPAGAIASTAADMARFLRFLMGDGALDGVRLLQPETMVRLRTRLFDDRPQAADMAHGFQARPMFGTMVYGHGGGVNEFLSNLAFIPEIGAGVFLSQNGGKGADLPLMVPTEILGVLAARSGLEAAAPKPVADAAARAAEAAGRHLTNRRTFSGPGQLLAALSPMTVTALPDGTLLIPTPLSQGPVRHEPFAPDIWQDAQGARMAFLRDETGRIVRLADGTGAQTHERLRGLADPVWLWLGLGLAALLSATSLLGLTWRHGLRGGTSAGTLVAAVPLAGAVSVIGLIGAGIVAGLAASRLGSQFLFDQPQPTLNAFLAMGDVVAVVAALALLALVPVWCVAGWSPWRRLHDTLFALSLAALAGLLLRWGLAFGGPI